MSIVILSDCKEVPMSTITTLLVETRALFLPGLSQALEQGVEFSVVGAELSLTAGRERARALQPALILLCLHGQERSALEALRGFLAGCQAPLLAVAERPWGGLQALEAGALGACTPDADPDSLLSGARAVARGIPWLGPQVMAELTAQLADRDQRRQRERKLTDRERQVLALVGQRKGYDEIAEALSIGRHTAKLHAQHIMDKLGVHDRDQLQVYVVRGAERSRVLDACLAVLGRHAANCLEGRLIGGGKLGCYVEAPHRSEAGAPIPLANSAVPLARVFAGPPRSPAPRAVGYARPVPPGRRG